MKLYCLASIYISNLPLKAHPSEPLGSDQNKYYLAQFSEQAHTTSLMMLLTSLPTYHIHRLPLFGIEEGVKFKKLSAYQIDRSFDLVNLVKIITNMQTKYPICLCTMTLEKLRR